MTSEVGSFRLPTAPYGAQGGTPMVSTRSPRARESWRFSPHVSLIAGLGLASVSPAGAAGTARARPGRNRQAWASVRRPRSRRARATRPATPTSSTRATPGSVLCEPVEGRRQQRWRDRSGRHQGRDEGRRLHPDRPGARGPARSGAARARSTRRRVSPVAGVTTSRTSTPPTSTRSRRSAATRRGAVTRSTSSSRRRAPTRPRSVPTRWR